ncbi:hypothetical protein FOQG_19280 [Fusarium oxysporum f. sp. raphani 54005]|uniref:Uncharacterized protein n=1 Tax=Fusarium oxysporum f. sp. raphani 54005 TaxID=1089458 RepID=X0BAV9_FUSOX|nr:hypothetical protein FOQG_19280 [Fusarium oxysporum f. sp. raphani 54005]
MPTYTASSIVTLIILSANTSAILILRIFAPSHLRIFAPSHLRIFTPSHLRIFASSGLYTAVDIDQCLQSLGLGAESVGSESVTKFNPFVQIAVDDMSASSPAIGLRIHMAK